MIKGQFDLRRMSLSSLLIAGSFAVASFCPVIPVNAAAPTAAKKVEDKAAKTESKRRSAQKTADKRKEIVSEAVSTVRETQDALKALDSGKIKDALAGLERATGKLEIVLAREPKVALVPIDVKVVTSDIYGSLDAIRSARQEAEKDLREGRLQEARAILKNLASETVISTANLPLASYPGALKKAAKLIDENKINEAKEILQNALDTLVVTDVVIPLPVVNARIALEKAEELAKTKNRTAEQSKQLTELVSAADTQIKYAEELGYGKKADFDSFHKEIEEITKKTAEGKSGVGFFDQIKQYMDSMTKNSQHKPDGKK